MDPTYSRLNEALGNGVREANTLNGSRAATELTVRCYFNVLLTSSMRTSERFVDMPGVS
jgi:hypothetical protein